ncbi:hypothetical protein [Brevibacillus brevis]|uniref:hypothetical protein n=1 Tax=Brevibacillus brevis TaxID=1393 RepID=UPI000D0F23AD|nr:hypothetical protein [Brevibacillus brevis]PSJ69670.1 hypothetical protein C7J99_09690 [Brevibacillus brevis]RED23204.1 hypothetical protein DES34_115178 [Brevibacillus brevis]GEC89534.1 hypothetical protein BBR01nite_18650 [Brevibacillus brevis]VEF87586.1 Uncharacterised protein [Brevibacillus brevis]
MKKKLIFIPSLALLIGLFTANEVSLAGPPDGWGIAPETKVIQTGDSEPTTWGVSPLGGPPDGW